MTDEERNELIKALRTTSDMQVTHWMRIAAADEIERLAEEVNELEESLYWSTADD
jgi:HAMP domain-containing protein